MKIGRTGLAAVGLVILVVVGIVYAVTSPPTTVLSKASGGVPMEILSLSPSP